MRDSAGRDGRGNRRSPSRRDVLKYAGTYAFAPALLSLGALAPGPGAPNASAAGMRLIDFAERRIAPDEIKSAGYDGVVNYVSLSRPGANFEAKPLTKDYADALRAAGLHPEADVPAYWAANDSLLYRDPDGRAVVFAPWVFGRDVEPAERSPGNGPDG